MFDRVEGESLGPFALRCASHPRGGMTGKHYQHPRTPGSGKEGSGCGPCPGPELQAVPRVTRSLRASGEEFRRWPLFLPPSTHCSW